MLNQGIFPESLKVVKIKHLFMKNYHHTIFNYRPFRPLPSISQVFEKSFINKHTFMFKEKIHSILANMAFKLDTQMS